MFDDDRSDVLLVVLELLDGLDVFDLLIDVLHGSFCFPFDPVGETVTTDHLDPLIQLPPWIVIDQ